MGREQLEFCCCAIEVSQGLFTIWAKLLNLEAANISKLKQCGRFGDNQHAILTPHCDTFRLGLKNDNKMEIRDYGRLLFAYVYCPVVRRLKAPGMWNSSSDMSSIHENMLRADNFGIRQGIGLAELGYWSLLLKARWE